MGAPEALPWEWTAPPPKPWDPKQDSPCAPNVDPYPWPDYYPPVSSVRDNLIWRVRANRVAHANRKIATKMRQWCARDVNYYIAGFCWLYETRRAGAIPGVLDSGDATISTIMPFVPYDYQLKGAEAIVASIRNQEDIAIPKSRDMGITWLTLMVIDWMWRFWPGSTALLLSEKEVLVDQRGKPNTLFEKLRFNMRRLPSFLQPNGWDSDGNDKYLLLKNPENESAIEGAATTGNAGRSGRYNVIFLDEHASLPENQALEVESSTADASPCRIYLSTPKGDKNVFYRKCHGDARRIDFHWTAHPYKGLAAWQEIKIKDGKVVRGKLRSPWYDHEVTIKRRGQPPHMIARELDIDFATPGETLFSTEILRTWRDQAPEPVGSDFARHRRDGKPALLIWEDPMPNTEYVLGLDPAGGVEGGSNAALQVFRVPGFVQVAEYQGKPGVDILSTLAYHLGRRYNWAFLCVEENIGKSIIAELLKGHIDREGIEGHAGAFLNRYPENRIAKHVGVDGKETDRFGITTSGTTKPYMVWSLLEPWTRQQEMIVRGIRTINEMTGFKQTGKDLCNPDGDDLVMSGGVAAYGYKFCWRPGFTGVMPFIVR